jgi:signal transduction histidine kinase/Flp pilus assembly protein TadD
MFMEQLRKRFCILVIVVFPALGYTQTENDSIRSLLGDSAPFEEKIKKYQIIITSLWLNHPDSAMIFAQQAVTLSKKSDDQKSKSIANRLLGGVHLYKGRYDSAMIYSKLAYALSLQTEDNKLISSSLNNIGFTLYHFGNYADALETLLKALKMKIEFHNNYGLAQTVNNIGLVYTKLKDLSKARTYFKDALIVSDSLNDNNQLLYSSNNLGFTYLIEEDYSNAKTSFVKSLEISKTVKNNNWTATAYSGLGQVWLKMGRDKEALAMFNKSLKLREEISDQNGISEIYYFLSQLNASKKQLDSAFYKIRFSQNIAKKIQSKNRQIENFAWYHTLFVTLKKYDSAIFYQGQFMKMKDSLFNENMARALADIQLKLMEEENALTLKEQEKQLKNRSELINILLVVVFCTLSAGIFIYKNYRRKKKLNKELQKKNEEINDQKQEILQHQEELKLTNEQLQLAKEYIEEKNLELKNLNSKLQVQVDLRTKELHSANKELKFASLELDNFVYRSAHDLRGPLVRLIGICNVALLDCQDLKAKEYFNLLLDTSIHLNDLFDRLKSVSEISNIDIQRNPVPINFTKILNKTKGRLKKIESFHSIRFIENIDESIDYTSDEFLIETIFYGLLENAVKFQKDSVEVDKFVKVNVERKGTKIAISFIDNGIGIHENQIDYLFQMFSAAAREKKNVGLGLYIVKQAVERLYGKIGISKSKSGYTRFRVSIPIKNKLTKSFTSVSLVST